MEDKEKAKTTLENLLHEALDHFLHFGAPYAGHLTKWISDDEPLLIMEAYGMQDALTYAIQDFGTDITADEIFDNFVAEMGCWWVATYSGVPAAMKLEREFFDRYFPILKEELEAKEQTPLAE